jgi:hypothetical protein
MFRYALGMNAGVVEIGESHTGGNVFQDFLHKSGVGGRCVAETERHLFELI